MKTMEKLATLQGDLEMKQEFEDTFREHQEFFEEMVRLGLSKEEEYNLIPENASGSIHQFRCMLPVL